MGAKHSYFRVQKIYSLQLLEHKIPDSKGKMMRYRKVIDEICNEEEQFHSGQWLA